MKAKILILGLALSLAGSAFGASYAPVPLTPSSFNYDCVIEATFPPLSYYSVTFTIDGGPFPAANGNTPMEIGSWLSGTADAAIGIPHSGSTWTSQAPGQSGHQYTMPSYWPSNNVLAISTDAGHTTGNLAVNDPVLYTGLSFVTTSGGGGTVMNVVVSHADGINETFNSVATSDWFSGTSPGPNIVGTTTNYWVWKPGGRGTPGSTTGAPAFANTGTTGSKLYSWDLLLTDTTSPLTNINVTFVSGGRTMFHCVSGSTDGVNYHGLASVSGYNEKGILLAVSPLPYNASMDNGTNIGAGSAGGNTWYEVGWYPGAPTTGFPLHNTTITSLATGRPYQMAPTYTGPMSALVDTNHQTVNITPATPQSYTAFSLLVAGAHISGSMSNILVMQHSDGSMETNIFFCFDWFNNTPVAFNAQGRADLDGGATVNNVSAGNPRLYESQFVLANSHSPVTNILIQFYNPGSHYGAGETTFIFAVSATAGGIPLTANTNTLAQNVYAGGTANFVTSVTAGNDANSAPHFKWQYSATEYGTYANLTDGVNGVAGSSTSNLTITGTSPANVGYYMCVVTNTVSTNITVASPLTLLVSTASLISKPGDPISDFGDVITSPAGQDDTRTSDGTLAQYLNFGANGGAAPFIGPLGYVTTPNIGNSIVTAMRFIASSSAPQNDPADYLLEGSNDGINFTAVANGILSLPDTRNENLTDPVDVTDQVLQEVTFPNNSGYYTYRVTINNVKTNATGTAMQVSEIQLLGSLTPQRPGILSQPATSQKLFVGESFLAPIVANGPGPLTYYWFRGATYLPAQTSATLTLNNVQLGDSGSYSCTVSNTFGTTNSTPITLTVLARPAGYASTILTDNPIAYWRLDEGPDNGSGNTGTIANDYAGSHNGIYTNVILSEPGYSVFDADTATAFATTSTSLSVVGGIQGINFANPTNLNTGAFSVEAWVNWTVPQSVGGAGIVCLGYGGGSEQFCLDCGGNAPNGFRFFFRDALTGASHVAQGANPLTGTNGTGDGVWHHLVGVLDEANTNEYLYIDGEKVATVVLTTNLGVLNSQSPTNPFTIGCRTSALNGVPTNQFSGFIDEVAVYNYALSSAQVQAHYFASGITPVLLISPTNVTASEGGTATFTGLAYGSPTLSYQWWHSDGNPTTPLSGQTSTNLTFNNLNVSLDGTLYQLVVTNTYGGITSSYVQLSVVSGPPQILPGGDLNANYVVFAGNPLVLPVSAGGSQPITYGWSYNSSPLANSARVSGATSNVLTIANAQVSDSGTYQLLMNNSRGGGQSALATVTVLPFLTFNDLGAGWTQNGATALFNGSNSVELTDGGGSEARSVFFAKPVFVGGFAASFTYQETSTGPADGVTFCIQNDSRGAAAVGPAGGGLGYGANSQNAGTSITPSVALELNIYNGNNLGGVGIDLDTDGLVGNITVPGSVNLTSGDPINISVLYLNGSATLTMTDAVAATSFTATLPINVPSVIGTNMGYVGFTGGTGGLTAIQTISNFSFESLAVPLSVSASGANVTLSWPTEVGGYQLQSNPSIHNAAGWTTLTNVPNIVGNQNQVVLPKSPGATYFRLVNP